MKRFDRDEPLRCPDCAADSFFIGMVGTKVWYECHYCGKTFVDPEREAKRKEAARRASEARKAKEDAYASLGMVKVRGSLGGTYYE